VIINNSTGRLVSAAEPAKVGDVLIIFATGLGTVSPFVPTGVPAAFNPLSRTLAPVTVTVGGIEARPLFSGLAPGFVGLYQVNVAIPPGVSTGRVNLVINELSAVSNSAPIFITD
jgi:uncharacterized protein (TIGR03437 family)